MDLFGSVEQLAFVQLLKSSFVVYPIVNALHIASIGMLLTSVLLLDLSALGLLRPPGGAAFMALMRRTALIGFASAAATGLLLFSVRAAHYAGLPVFQLKLGLIVLAGFNLLIFLRLEPRDPGKILRWSAAGSLLIWSGVLLCGRFIGFV
ncbi:MAG: hypothetical protein M9955_06170 [Rhizobiaceae bacterium]|nr:hypothetical protein [Rhizobiaceae bacterium]